MSSKGPISNAITFGQLNELVQLRGSEIVPIELNGKNYHIKLSRLITLFDKEVFGLDLVDNTRDIDKPLSSVAIEALGLKADLEHTHELSEVIGLEEELLTKAGLEHSHAIDDVDGLNEMLDSITTSVNGFFSEIVTLRDDLLTKVDIDHSHDMSQVDGLNAAIQSLQDQLYTLASQPSSNEHNHSIDQILGLTLILNGKSNANHSHTVSSIGDFDPSVRGIVTEMTAGIGSSVVVTEPEW